jgi:V8-like Glu-specific endopeptidase
MRIDAFQIEATLRRYQEREKYRARNLRLIAEGHYLDIDSPERVEKFLTRHGFSRNDTAAFLRRPGRGAPAAAETVAGRQEPYALERVLGTNDLMGVAFLEGGLQVARSVSRVWIGVASGRPSGFGTGFLISPRLLMTNHHVLGDRTVARTSLAEFDYQFGLAGALLPTTTFALDPDTFHCADQHLDYAVVAVKPAATNGRPLCDFGWNPLIEAEGKAIAPQWVNIIQHPNGDPKQLGLRENQLIDVLDEFLHYKTDTAPGSSGSPVYNDRWEVVALHHSGVWATNAAGQVLAVDGQPWTEAMGEDRIKWIANEGVRISRIIAHLRRQTMTDAQRRLFDEIVTAVPPEDVERGTVVPPERPAGVVVSPEGAATWTIPLSISVRVGGQGGVQPVAAPAAVPAPTTLAAIPTGPAIPAVAAAASPDPESVVQAARRELGSRADVLDVRLGYVFRDGWITKDRALVVTVRQKTSPAALREARIPLLPKTYQGLPVQVCNPMLEDLVRLARGPAVAEAAFREPGTIREEITYVPPTGVSLDQASRSMRVVAHVSPDAGWPQLEAFLGATKKRLVVGMYDFGAKHIVEAVEAVATKGGFEKLTLVMQHGESVGSGTKADDLTDDEVVERLESAAGGKFENAWVHVGPVNGWVSRSYHIKVAVRDRKAFWISSGNWQSSNQPDAEPLTEKPPKCSWLTRYNREWHAIVEDPGLAKTFEAFLLHDFKENRDFVPREEIALPDLLMPEAFFVPSAAERARPFSYFKPLDETRRFTVQPLLTPDNYHEHVLRLVKSADEELLIQNQTFNAPGENQEKLRELVDAVLAKQQAGVKVRIIFRVLFASKARKVLEELKDFGFNMDDFKVQTGCHTKGIVADRKRVLVGSENWSNEGVSVNRDASLLFEDEPLAKYFGKIFDHDWDNLAKQDIGSEALAPEVASAGETTPAGMVRLRWKDYMEML